MTDQIKIDKRLIEKSPGSFIFEFDNEISPEKCDEIINRFEESKDDHYRGRVGPNFKDSWKDIDEIFFISLSKALAKMKKEYDFFNGKFKDIGYAIQRTDVGEYFHWHIDTGSHQMSDRQLVAIWYLNDVDGPGGETEFLHQKVKIKPERGKLVIFPPFWTHEHRGVTVKKGSKYIATTWIVFK